MSSRFAHRSSAFEIMDDLDCKGEVVHQTLRELEIINKWLGGNLVTLDGIHRLLSVPELGKNLTIVDVGCGGGDMLKLIAEWGRKNNITLQLLGIDANPNIIAFAKANTVEYPEIRYETQNVFSDDFANHRFDLIIATLFTHHFSKDELVNFFMIVNHQARLGVVINDLHRHWFAYYAIQWLTRFFSKSPMVKYDAPLSVLRAFKRAELEQILSMADIKNFKLRWKWAFRWQLIIPASLA